MSLGSFGYMAGGLSSGILAGLKYQQDKKLADADIKYKGQLGDEATARGQQYGVETDLAKQKGAREQTAFDSRRSSLMDAADAIEQGGNKQFADQLRYYAGSNIPKVGAANSNPQGPSATTAQPTPMFTAQPPATQGLTVPFDLNRPTFGSY